MGTFLIRRLAISFGLLLASTFIMYWLVTISGDPLADLYERGRPEDRERLIAERIQTLELDRPWAERYLSWLAGASRCLVPGLTCDLGASITGQDVATLVVQGITSTLSLVLAATVLAIVLGVSVGIVSALRQYSAFDYTLTFAAFLFFSLPVFWVAVLLKQYAAIQFNDWLADPTISVPVIVVMAVLSGLIWVSVIGGDRRRRLLVFAAATAATAVTLGYLSAVQWFSRPALGPAAVIAVSLATAVGISVLGAGLRRRRVVASAVAAAAVISVAGVAADGWLQREASWPVLLVLLVVASVVGAGIGAAAGGIDRGAAVRAAAGAGVLALGVVTLDQILRAVPGYADRLNGRVVATIGARTPNFQGSFWQEQLDLIFHLALPTVALVLISFATYTRFTRSAMLEVLNLDYVRTARAKGLNERTVVVNHAFRNALIPVTTLAAIDFGTVLGGAVITETVFGRPGLGSLLVDGVLTTDPNRVLGAYIVLAVAIIVFNMIADIVYAYLDPRIRLS